MYKFNTKLAFFKFKNVSFSKGDLPIDWFVLDEDEEGGRPFTHEELNKIKDYVATRALNFPGEKNYFESNEEEGPYCGLETALNDNISFPELFILREKPIPLMHSMGVKCVDIFLTDINGNSTHDFNLPFNVIGKVVS